ncbi:LPS assembly lipoprotein LptE [Shimia abyssi]|uniref:LPS-assembly lipoprotein n=1 Tax=Shimia abyssi TaxID=1662395 RepID=A0A2P8FHY4_9RHOB|nr:LPS assembly lipoprotein LptE [Shimia abyssi]PSL21318.1 LPS-assembly lipoprotein [Shimia abyssi]
MSSFNRRSLLLLTAASGLTLSGCGFEPVYGTDGAATALQDNVAIDEPNDNATYLLVRELEDRLGRGRGGEDFGLSLKIITDQKSVGRTVAQVTTRFDITGEATYSLRNLDSKEVVTTGKVNSFTSYSTTGSTVAELAAETDAFERLMVILADLIVADLQAYSTTNPL